MRSLKLQKNVLRTATGPDLEYARGIRPLDSPTPDLVAGGNPTTQVCSVLVTYSVTKSIDYSVERTQKLTRSERTDSKKGSEDCRPSTYTSAVSRNY